MINGKRIVIVMPAYNAEKTLEQTLARAGISAALAELRRLCV